MKLFQDISLMEKFLDVQWKRHEVISNNIANADVPGFKRTVVVFEQLLQQHLDNVNLPMAVTRHRHLRKNISIEPKVIRQTDRTYRNDGNNVDIEKEMVEATKNAYSYNITADQVARKFQMLQSAISEGRK